MLAAVYIFRQLFIPNTFLFAIRKRINLTLRSQTVPANFVPTITSHLLYYVTPLRYLAIRAICLRRWSNVTRSQGRPLTFLCGGNAAKLFSHISVLMSYCYFLYPGHIAWIGNHVKYYYLHRGVLSTPLCKKILPVCGVILWCQLR